MEVLALLLRRSIDLETRRVGPLGGWSHGLAGFGESSDDRLMGDMERCMLS